MEDQDDQEHIDNKYSIDKYLSYGAEGEVYLVTEKKTNIKYAAKISFSNKKYLDNEIEILKILKEKECKNILNIINSGRGIIQIAGQESKIRQYLILELAPNRDLGEYIFLEKKGFGEYFSKVIFYQIVKCIKSIHDLNYCHKDIKIDNILLDEKFNPKINDFGFAKKYSNSLDEYIGTESHKAPEILEKKPYDGFKVDIFSLGVTLIHLTTCSLGFRQATINEKYYQYIYKKDLASYWNLENFKKLELSDDFKDLYIGMVSYEPDERYSLDTILEHKWFGKIRTMNDEELEKYKDEIGLKKEFENRLDKILKSKSSQYKAKDKKKDKINPSKGLPVEKNSHFEKDAKADYIKINKFMNYYIDIEGNLKPVNFMDSLFDKIVDKFKDDKYYKCYIKADKKLKLKLTFEQKENEDEDEEEKDENELEDELIMEIILYKTPKGYLLRFIKEKMNKRDFIEKYVTISKLVKELVE